jgi:hypothetical protein
MKILDNTGMKISAIFFVLLFACAPAQSTENDVCSYKQALSKILSIASKDKVAKRELREFLLENSYYDIPGYERPPLPTRENVLKRSYNGNLSFLFFDTKSFDYFKRFVSKLIKDCNSSTKTQTYMKFDRPPKNYGIKFLINEKSDDEEINGEEDLYLLDYDFSIMITIDDFIDGWAIGVSYIYCFQYRNDKIVLYKIFYTN